jgi:hypothetical protein
MDQDDQCISLIIYKKFRIKKLQSGRRFAPAQGKVGADLRQFCGFWAQNFRVVKNDLSPLALSR